MTFKKVRHQPTVIQSLVPIVLLLALILTNVFFLPDDTLGGANQLALLVAAAVAALIAWRGGVTGSRLMKMAVHTVGGAVPPILILLMVGALSGSWMLSGVIPTMIYYGLDVLHPSYFLPACVVLTAVVSVATGSSWSTVATVGVALIGIGSALGFNEAYTAGAIISGAYFGDKVSPLSDTTNLASAVAKVDLFTHIRYMMRTTVPTVVLTLGFFTALTLWVDHSEGAAVDTEEFRGALAGTYRISAWLLLIPAATVWLIVRRVPAVVVLLVSSLLAACTAGLVQSDLIGALGGDSPGTVYGVLSRALFGATAPKTGSAAVDSLVATGGMAGMMNTVWLILTAMVFGGVMEAGRFLERITRAVLKRVHSRGGVVASTVGSCLMFNAATGDQYIAVVVPGKMFLSAYLKRGLEGRLLSRTLEDSATVTSVLIPWNTCGATQATILGVSTWAYAPWAVFCWLSPLTTLFMAYTGIGIKEKQ